MPATDAVQTEDPMVVHAEAEKSFFIDMLIRDIKLSEAVLDLVDNSVDRARRLRTVDGKPATNYDGLFIRINVDPTGFKMIDTCGGMDVDTARNYAFKFGRSTKSPSVKHSVGQFGIGMKRALFKMGKHFVVESKTEDSHFIIDVPVDHWQNHEKSWTFRFASLEEKMASPYPPDERGLSIEVKNLHTEVANDFNDRTFIGQLKRDIEGKHGDSLSKGLTIILNHANVGFNAATLLVSDEIHPAHIEKQYSTAPDKDPIHVQLWAGIGESDSKKAGWYVYCNGRCVLSANQQTTTGWESEDGVEIPKYHNQYRWFRGYVFFDCDDASFLPWNTTKNGLNEDSPIYRDVRRIMMAETRPVIDFLNQLKDEAQSSGLAMQDVFPTATRVNLADAETRAVARFTYVKKPKQTKIPERAITYRKPTQKVQVVMEMLGLNKPSEAGSATFDYFYEKEVEA
jgi:hypothetical protein